MTAAVETVSPVVSELSSLPDARWQAARRAGTHADLLTDPAVQGAMQIRVDPIQAGQVEAYVLAGAPPEAIATNCGYPLAWITAYESLFYDIRSRREDRDWIFKHAIDRRHPDYFEEDEVQAFLQVYGFMHGPRLLEELLKMYELHTLATEGLAPIMADTQSEN